MEHIFIGLIIVAALLIIRKRYRSKKENERLMRIRLLRHSSECPMDK